ncbi:MAG: ATP synthase F1 subunit epsilon [Alphaproteobacteria bacterium]|nr:ATP synthase F1 subunit epsilon [Alphaproteobacteria bacterium]
METFPFTLVSPEKILLEREVSMVVIPGLNGDIGVLPNHAPLLTLLRPGVVRVYDGTKIFMQIFVNGGFSEITPHKCVTLVTEGTLLEFLDKSTLEIEIKNLLEDIEISKTTEEREQVGENLDIARAKLMEILTNEKMQ